MSNDAFRVATGAGELFCWVETVENEKETKTTNRRVNNEWRNFKGNSLRQKEFVLINYADSQVRVLILPWVQLGNRER